MKHLLLVLLIRIAVPARSLSFFGNETQQAMYVAQMQNIFVVRDGSTISNPTDPTVLGAIRRELSVISPKFGSMQDISGVRDPAVFTDQDMSRLVLLAIMGNFHTQSLQDADLYNDVQVRYDPLGQRFVTKQNMRDTEILVFQALLVICVIGLFVVFVREKRAPQEKKEAIHIEATKSRINLPDWTKSGKARHRDSHDMI